MVIACVNEVSKNCMKRLMHVVAVKCMNGTCNFSKIHTNISFLNSSLCFFINKIIIVDAILDLFITFRATRRSCVVPQRGSSTSLIGESGEISVTDFQATLCQLTVWCQSPETLCVQGPVMALSGI